MIVELNGPDLVLSFVQVYKYNSRLTKSAIGALSYSVYPSLGGSRRLYSWCWQPQLGSLSSIPALTIKRCHRLLFSHLDSHLNDTLVNSTMQQAMSTKFVGEPNPLDNTGLCLLSLDGGGVRGLSTLYILKGIMDRLNRERKTVGLPPMKPCEVFDLMGGTSTGG